MEVGVGEATTLYSVIKRLDYVPDQILGFDISWSRLKFAKSFLEDFNMKDVTLFKADLFKIPLLDNSIDIVYTSHSIEPNGGRESEALQELYRVSGKYLVLIEPAFEFANKDAQKRMIDHGYITKLYSTAVELGYNIVEHRLFDHSQNPLNPTGIIIIEKKTSSVNSSSLKCPVSLSDLIKYNDSFYYSDNSFLSYPILDGIPCLLSENAILTSHLLTDYNDFKEANGISIK